MPATILYQTCASDSMRTEDAIRLFDYCLRLRDERRRAIDHPAGTGHSANHKSNNQQADDSLAGNIELQCDNLFRERPDTDTVQRIGTVTRVLTVPSKHLNGSTSPRKPAAVTTDHTPPHPEPDPSPVHHKSPSSQSGSGSGSCGEQRSAGIRTPSSSASPAGPVPQVRTINPAIVSPGVTSNGNVNSHTSSDTGLHTSYRFPNDISVTIKQEMLQDQEDGITSRISGCATSTGTICSNEIQFLGQVDVASHIPGPDHNHWEKMDGQADRSKTVPPIASPTRCRPTTITAAAAAAAVHSAPAPGQGQQAKTYSRSIMFADLPSSLKRPATGSGTQQQQPSSLTAPSSAPTSHSHVRSILNGPLIANATPVSSLPAGDQQRNRAKQRVSFDVPLTMSGHTSSLPPPEAKRYRTCRNIHN